MRPPSLTGSDDELPTTKAVIDPARIEDLVRAIGERDTERLEIPTAPSDGAGSDLLARLSRVARCLEERSKATGFPRLEHTVRLRLKRVVSCVRRDEAVTSTALGRATRIPPSAASRASQPPALPMTCSWLVTAVLLGTAAALLLAILVAPWW